MSKRGRKDFLRQDFLFFRVWNDLFFKSSPLMVQQKFFANAA
jgi:hypothetical protein